jgi:hypothetical protein
MTNGNGWKIVNLLVPIGVTVTMTLLIALIPWVIGIERRLSVIEQSLTEGMNLRLVNVQERLTNAAEHRIDMETRLRDVEIQLAKMGFKP